MKRWLKMSLAAALALVILCGLALVWLLQSAAGAQFVLAQALQATAGKLTIGGSEGTLAGPLRLTDVHWHDTGIDVYVGSASIDLAPLALLSQTVYVQSLQLNNVMVASTTQTPPAAPTQPAALSLVPPIGIQVDALNIVRLEVTTDDETVFQANSLTMVARWNADELVVKQLALKSPDGEVDLNLELNSLTDYAGGSDGSFRWRVQGIDYVGTLKASNDRSLAQVTINLQQPIQAIAMATRETGEKSPWKVGLNAPLFEPKRILPETTLRSLALAIEGTVGKNAADIQGSIAVNEHLFVIDPLRLGWTPEQLTLDALTLSAPPMDGVVHARGRLPWAALNAKPADGADATAAASLELDWNGVRLPADLVGQELASAGKLSLAGSAAAFRAQGKLALGPPERESDVALDISGNTQHLTLSSVTVRQKPIGKRAGGRLDLKGDIDLRQPAWNIEASAADLDPSAFAAEWPGALSFTLNSEGQQHAEGVAATLKLDALQGTLRQRPVNGTADLSIAPGWQVTGTLALASGQSNLALHGRGGQQTDASVGFSVASLGDVLPDAQGSVRGEFTLKGQWPALAVKGRLDGQTLGAAGWTARTLQLDADLSDISAPRGSVHALANEVSNTQLQFERITLDGRGDRTAHELNLQAKGKPLSTELQLRGVLTDAAWSGSLNQWRVSLSEQPEWTLERPASLSWQAGEMRLGELCLAASGPRLCVAGSQAADGSATASYRIEKLPLATLAALSAADATYRLDGEINGSGDIRRGSKGELSGDAHLQSAQGRVIYPDSAAKALLDYRDFALDATLGAQRRHASLRAQLADGGRISGNVDIDGATQVLSGSIDAELGTLAFVELLTAEIAAPSGRLSSRIVLGGTLASPLFSGQLTLADVAAEIPAAGLKLSAGGASVRIAPDGAVTLEGSVKSGNGQLTLQGSGGLDAGSTLDLRIDGSDFLAADIPAARVVIAPKLHLQRTTQGLQLSGDVGVPSANVDLTKLPGGGAAKTSPDVVIVDQTQAEREEALPLTADITLRLGDEVRLKGMGLDGKLDGQLVVIERPGRQTTGRGEIRVGGTYKAYGQDLTIRTGRLLFAGTAIDNPGIDLRAVRELKDVTAGLRVQGTAQVPVLTVYSEPAMEQSEALSYLITGRPLSALKSGESDLVGAAAQALGSATGDLLAKSIGARLGVDAGVSDNTALGGAALTVGKYLSPKLYLSYGVGIFTPGEVITLRYTLSKRWELEAQSATTENRAGLNYRYEK